MAKKSQLRMLPTVQPNGVNSSNNNKKLNKTKNQLTAPVTLDSTGGRINKSLSADATTYDYALRDPFNSRANGARVPDFVSAPTVTLRISKRVTVTADANGIIRGILLPNAFANGVFQSCTIAGGAPWNAWSGTSINTTGLLITGTGNLSGRLANYRLVGWGAKFVDLASMTNVSGQVTIGKIAATRNAFIPAKTNIGGNANANASFTVEAWFNQNGIPYSGSGDSAVIDIATLVSLPEHKVYSGLELAQNGCQVRSKPISSAAFDFQNCQDSAAGDDPVPGIATGAIYVGDSSYARLSGFETIVFGGTGFPASTACLDIELVYHLEGTPANSGSSGVSLDGVRASPSKMSDYFSVLDRVADAASFIPALSTPANVYRAMRGIAA